MRVYPKKYEYVNCPLKVVINSRKSRLSVTDHVTNLYLYLDCPVLKQPLCAWIPVSLFLLQQCCEIVCLLYCIDIKYIVPVLCLFLASYIHTYCLGSRDQRLEKLRQQNMAEIVPSQNGENNFGGCRSTFIQPTSNAALHVLRFWNEHLNNHNFAQCPVLKLIVNVVALKYHDTTSRDSRINVSNSIQLALLIWVFKTKIFPNMLTCRNTNSHCWIHILN